MAGSANAAIEKLNDPGAENSLFSDDIKKGGAVCECMLLSISSSLFELKRILLLDFLFRIVSNCVRMTLVIYLSEPFPSPMPEYLRSFSPEESLLCSSIGRLLLPQTNSIGSDLTSSFRRFGGDGVMLSLSVREEESPFPFEP